jgi:hypothetical protein
LSINRKIRLSFALPIILAFSALAFGVVNQRANTVTDTPKTVWGEQQCLSCHSDLATLKKMQEKKGDPTFCQAAYDRILKNQASSPIKGQPTWGRPSPNKSY